MKLDSVCQLVLQYRYLKHYNRQWNHCSRFLFRFVFWKPKQTRMNPTLLGIPPTQVAVLGEASSRWDNS